MKAKDTGHEFIPHPNPSYAWIVLSVSLLFLFFRPLLLVYPSFMIPEIMQDFHISAKGVGWLVGATTYGVILFQIPAGILIDWYGPRKIGSLGIFISATGTLLFALTCDFTTALIGRIIIGAGISIVIIDTLKLIANWFEPRRFALFAGITIGVGYIGDGVGGVFVNQMKLALGWRTTILSLSLIAFIYSLIYLLIIHDGVLGAKYDINPQIKKFKFSKALKKFFTRPQSWLIFLFACFSLGTLPAFPALWSVTYFQVAYQVSEHKANIMHLVMHAGFSMAFPLIAYLSTRVKKRKIFIQIGALAYSLLLAALFSPTPLFFTPLLLFFIGIAGGSLVLPMILIHERNVPKITATTIAFIYTSIPIFGGIFIELIGLLVDPYLNGSSRGTYSPPLTPSFMQSFYLFPVSFLIAFIISFFLKETHCRQRLQERYR